MVRNELWNGVRNVVLVKDTRVINLIDWNILLLTAANASKSEAIFRFVLDVISSIH